MSVEKQTNVELAGEEEASVLELLELLCREFHRFLLLARSAAASLSVPDQATPDSSRSVLARLFCASNSARRRLISSGDSRAMLQ